MTRLKDKSGKIAEIEMMTWMGDQYSLDWSQDFFEVGALPYDEDADAWLVDDVEYCIDQAEDWRLSRGDFSEDEPNENHTVFVTRI